MRNALKKQQQQGRFKANANSNSESLEPPHIVSAQSRSSDFVRAGHLADQPCRTPWPAAPFPESVRPSGVGSPSPVGVVRAYRRQQEQDPRRAVLMSFDLAETPTPRASLA